MVWCTTCGTKLEESAVFCWQCGTRACRQTNHPKSTGLAGASPGIASATVPPKKVAVPNKTAAPATATSAEQTEAEQTEAEQSEAFAKMLGLSADCFDSLKSLRSKFSSKRVSSITSSKRVSSITKDDKKSVQEDDDFPIFTRAKRQKTKVVVIPDDDQKDPTSDEDFEDFELKLPQKIIKRPKVTEKEEVKDGTEMKEKEAMVQRAIDLVMAVQKEGDDQKVVEEKMPMVEEEVQREEDVEDVLVQEKGADASGLDDEENERDHELQRFLILQRKLQDRKEEANKRISSLKGAGPHRSFNVIYTSMGCRSLVFRAPLDGHIGILYDFVCANLDAPAHFHLRDNNSNEYTSSHKGKLEEVPGLLFLEEEEYLNGTVTNFDEVIFK